MLPSLYVYVIISLGIGIHLMNFVYLFRFVRRRIAKGWNIPTVQWLLLALLSGPLVWIFWMLCIWCYPEQYHPSRMTETLLSALMALKVQ